MMTETANFVRPLMILTGISFFLTAAEAREYWVSPRGNDRATGRKVTPWQTLQHAADQVVAGDTVNVPAGNYQGFNVTRGGTASARITFRARPGAVINQAWSSSGNHYGINASGQSYLTIEGFTFIPQASQAAWGAAIRLGGTPGNWIYGNVIQNNTIQMGQSSTPDGCGIYASWSNGVLIENNTVSGTGDSGIYVANSSLNYTISGNTVYNCGGNGIHNNGDVSQGNPGINYNALIENNIIYNVGFSSAGQAISCDGVQDSRIQNNLIYAAHGKGISLYKVNSAEGSRRDIVVNNTVLTAADGGAALRMVDDSSGNTVLNNILYSANPSSASIDLLSGDLTGLRSDYNVVKNRFYSDGSKLPFGEWQGLGKDIHSFIATPFQLFFNPEANDYRLSSKSPAIDAGTTASAPRKDLKGNTRPRGHGIDIGAYESNENGQ